MPSRSIGTERQVIAPGAIDASSVTVLSASPNGVLARSGDERTLDGSAFRLPHAEVLSCPSSMAVASLDDQALLLLDTAA